MQVAAALAREVVVSIPLAMRARQDGRVPAQLCHLSRRGREGGQAEAWTRNSPICDWAGSRRPLRHGCIEWRVPAWTSGRPGDAAVAGCRQNQELLENSYTKRLHATLRCCCGAKCTWSVTMFSSRRKLESEKSTASPPERYKPMRRPAVGQRRRSQTLVRCMKTYETDTRRMQISFGSFTNHVMHCAPSSSIPTGYQRSSESPSEAPRTPPCVWPRQLGPLNPRLRVRLRVRQRVRQRV
jgi:hypothetical protein